MEEEKGSNQICTILEEMSKVVIGRQKEIKLILTALLTKGHVLIEDLPGMGKTTMVKAFSRVIDCPFSRIQCTPDLLPSDVIGSSIYNQKTAEFTLRKGPVFTNILLVDEINRTLPRTQSSLLESMEEKQVSIEGKTYPLSEPFIVLATQNPIDTEGTFPLPEAQLDRFLLKISLGYPSIEEEEEMLEKVGDLIPYDSLKAVLNPSKIKDWQSEIQNVYVRKEIHQYIIALAQQAREHSYLKIGPSPRATKALYQISKTWAFLQGRDYVLPDDVKDLVHSVWGHRLVLSAEGVATGLSQSKIIDNVLQTVAVPEEKVIHGN